MSQLITFAALAASARSFVRIGRERLIAATEGVAHPKAKALNEAAKAANKDFVSLPPRAINEVLSVLNPEVAPVPASPPQPATVDPSTANTQGDRTSPEVATGSTNAASDTAIANVASSVTSDATADPAA